MFGVRILIKFRILEERGSKKRLEDVLKCFPIVWALLDERIWASGSDQMEPQVAASGWLAGKVCWRHIAGWQRGGVEGAASYLMGYFIL